MWKHSDKQGGTKADFIKWTLSQSDYTPTLRQVNATQLVLKCIFTSNLSVIWGLFYSTLRNGEVILQAVHSCDCRASNRSGTCPLAFFCTSWCFFLTQKLTANNSEFLLLVLYEFCYLVLLPLYIKTTKGSEATKSYLPKASHWLARLTPGGLANALEKVLT